MKKIIRFLLMAFSVLLLGACSTSQKVTIQGIPGTEIYSPSMNRLGVIGSNAQVTLKISSDDYFAYLMSRNADSNELVPFALDYKNHGYVGTTATAYLGTIAAFGGYLSTAALSDDLVLVGSGVSLLGATCALPSCWRLGQTQYKHKYKYLSAQATNQDLRFAKIVDFGYKKTLQNDDVSETVAAKTINPNNSATSSTVVRKKYSVSKRTLNDNAELVSGTYSGTGYLSQKNKTIEEYSNIKVVVLRIDNNTVNVDVIESGESYFSTKNKYLTKKKGKNTYVLSLNGIPDAFITIDKAGHLTYIHPKVNIDGEIYTLNITANKK